MESQDKDRPRSLFGDDDVRHSVATVNERWEREMSRRKRLAAKIYIPIVVLLLGGYLSLAYAKKFFPFAVVPEPLPPPPEEVATPQKAGGPIEKMGNPEAKFKLRVILSKKLDKKCPEKILAVLHEATDCKPSTIYIEIMDEESAPKHERELLQPNGTVVYTMFGEPVIPMPTTEEELIKGINNTYAVMYKYPKPVIDPSRFGLEKANEKALEEKVERVKQQERDDNIQLRLPNMELRED